MMDGDRTNQLSTMTKELLLALEEIRTLRARIVDLEERISALRFDPYKKQHSKRDIFYPHVPVKDIWKHEE